MNRLVLSQRLLTVSRHVRDGAFLADIGSDHGYLPIYLLQKGKIKRAIISDINEGPLNTARENAALSGVCDRVDFFLSDGALEFLNYPFTDVSVCGMGGELICSIIENAPSFKNEGVRLILQPMSKQSVLRKYLCENGFEILFEEYSLDAGKYYLTLVAHYTGEKKEISDIYEELGDIDTRVKLNRAETGYLRAKARSLRKSISGKQKANINTLSEEELLLKINQILNSKGWENESKGAL